MTYHDNPNHPPNPRRSSYGIMAVIGLLALLVVAGLALSMMGGNDNVATNDRPAAITPSATGSGAVVPAAKRETTGQKPPQQTTPPAPN
jgi:hypothetical protein